MRSSVQARPARDAGPGPGAVVRSARIAQRLSLAELGARVGYSAAQVSRYERGIAPLTDIGLLRRFSSVLGIPPQEFGLTPAVADPARHAVSPQNRSAQAGARYVVPESRWEDGDDPVRRRDMITSAAALAGTAALGTAGGARGTPSTPEVRLEDVLYGRIDAAPVPLDRLGAAVTSARNDFRAARYGRLPVVLPKIIAAAQATSENADGSGRAKASGLLADAYILAADFAVKVNDDPLSWMTADRALQAAQASGDPLLLADARRAVAIAMRRAHHPGRACDLLTRACLDIQPGPGASPDQLAAYGSLLAAAAYTAATAGNRRAADEYITEAASAAGRLGTASGTHPLTFSTAGVTLYRVSIAQVLGDNGTAIEHARTLRPAQIPTSERQGRYWVDVARAYHQWGRPDACYRALLAAECAAPAEVRYRPPVHRMTEDLLRRDTRGSQPGLRTFAHRIGVPGA